MADSAKKRKWFLASVLLLTLMAVVWVSQSDENSVQENLVNTQQRESRHNSTTVKNDEANHGVRQSLRYSNNVKELFSAPVIHQPPPLITQEVYLPLPPPLPFSYIGRMVEDDLETLFLSSPQHNYVAHSGEVIEGDYRIDSISDDEVHFTYLPLALTQILEIGE